jgi:hypothetical protein
VDVDDRRSRRPPVQRSFGWLRRQAPSNGEEAEAPTAQVRDRGEPPHRLEVMRLSDAASIRQM